MGTHGVLMMGDFLIADLNYLHSILKLGIYRMEFNELKLDNVQKIRDINMDMTKKIVSFTHMVHKLKVNSH